MKGVCKKCGSDNLYYGSDGMTATTFFYYYTCCKCGHGGKEIYELIFKEMT